VAVGTALYTRQSDLAQVCVAGLIGFLGAKAGDMPGNGSNNVIPYTPPYMPQDNVPDKDEPTTSTAKEEKIDEMA
jgi:hypothetical protein